MITLASALIILGVFGGAAVSIAALAEYIEWRIQVHEHNRAFWARRFGRRF